MTLRRPKPKIVLSLTPLIDVVFILLIFFMLVSQFTDWRQVQLTPQAQFGGHASDDRALSVRLLNDGSFEVDGEAMRERSAAVAKLVLAGDKKDVFVSVEDVVEIQSVVDLIEILTKAGVSNVRLSEAPFESGS